MKKLFTGIVLITFCVAAFAQKQVEHQQLVWYAYINTIKFNPTWTLVSEVQERRFINPSAQHQFVVRAHIHRDLGSGWDAGAGMSLFFQSPNDPESEIDLVVPELRPHFEVRLHQKFSALSVDHRYRAEARFFHQVNSNFTALEDGYQYSNIRLRYRLQFLYPIVKFNEIRTLGIKAGDELFINLGSTIVNNFFDQNRLFAALNMVFSRTITLEAGYMNWFQQQKSGVDYYNRDILVFTLYHSIESKRTL